VFVFTFAIPRAQTEEKKTDRCALGAREIIMNKTYPFLLLLYYAYARPFSGVRDPTTNHGHLTGLFSRNPYVSFPLSTNMNIFLSLARQELALGTSEGQMGPSFNLHGRVRALVCVPSPSLELEIGIIKNVPKTTARE